MMAFTHIAIEVVNKGEKIKDPRPTESMFFETNKSGKTFPIIKAYVISEGTNEGMPSIILEAEVEKGKFIELETTARILNGVVAVAKGVAARNGKYDF